MKRTLLIICLLTLHLFSTAQISGGFFSGTDCFGNMFIYFKGTNNSQYNFNIEITSINYQLNQQKQWNCLLESGNSFTIGPSDGWYWQIGERLIVRYPNGQSIFWIYPPSLPFNDQNLSNKRTGRSLAEIELDIQKAERELEWNENKLQSLMDKNECITLWPSYQQIIRRYKEKLEKLRIEKINAQ